MDHPKFHLKTFKACLSFVFIALTGCAGHAPSNTQVVIAPPPAQNTQAASETPVNNSTTAETAAEMPRPAEVREALVRVFENAVQSDVGHKNYFFTGDFNGDGSQDIAIIVTPNKDKLEDLNSEVANWIVEDPRKIMLPDPKRSVQSLPSDRPARIAASDTLLAVIHGYNALGWRNRDAKQTYLLKNAVGQGLKSERIVEARPTTKDKTLPHHQSGDLLQESLDGENGYLYWTGSKYAWHSLLKPK